MEKKLLQTNVEYIGFNDRKKEKQIDRLKDRYVDISRDRWMER